jgi:hypothetical protein
MMSSTKPTKITGPAPGQLKEPASRYMQRDIALAGRAEAVAAVCACFRQSYRTYGNLDGVLTLESDVRTAEGLLSEALTGTSFTLAELDGVYLIVPVPDKYPEAAKSGSPTQLRH